MKKTLLLSFAMFALPTGFVWADTFGTGENQFEIEFVTISGDSGDLGSWSAGHAYTFSGVNHGDYRMGTYEITYDQWNKFKAAYGTVTGTPSDAYDLNPHFTGTNVPADNTSWYEAAQFVNYLNTCTGYQPAYKFTGTQGTSNYTFSLWESGDTGYDSINPYRNSNAYYFLPTEDEWVKAAYWNGTTLQTYTTVGDVAPTQDGWNFYDDGYATDPIGLWDVGSGVEEINGTFDMMGNAVEWMENPYFSGNYSSSSARSIRGGSFNSYDYYLESSFRFGTMYAGNEYRGMGFRIASVIPEPTTLPLLGMGGLLMRKRK